MFIQKRIISISIHNRRNSNSYLTVLEFLGIQYQLYQNMQSTTSLPKMATLFLTAYKLVTKTNLKKSKPLASLTKHFIIISFLASFLIF